LLVLLSIEELIKIITGIKAAVTERGRSKTPKLLGAQLTTGTDVPF